MDRDLTVDVDWFVDIDYFFSDGGYLDCFDDLFFDLKRDLFLDLDVLRDLDYLLNDPFRPGHWSWHFNDNFNRFLNNNFLDDLLWRDGFVPFYL